MKNFLFSLFILLGMVSATWAQRTISGKVTDSGGSPLIGVNILEAGTSNGVVTDLDGNYTLSVSEGATVVFSYTGFTEQSIPVGAQSVINITLQEGVALDEVVVTALGISREKKSLTYAAQNINTQEISQARDLNVVNSLSGKVAGISIMRSGAGVGAPSRVILRGNRSLFGNNQPLYIVDGAPILGDLTSINPDDIESISVLKGANAAALYGNRGQNGVIIISTKKGKEGFNVSLNTTYMNESPLLLRNYQTQFGQGNNGKYNKSSEDAWGASIGGSADHWSPDPNFPSKTYSLTANDPVGDFFQNGHNFATSLSISSASAKTQTYFSYTFTDAAGVVPTNELNRHNAHLRITNQISNKLTLDTKLNYVREDYDNILPQGENFANPVRHAYRLPANVRTEDIEIFEYTDALRRNRQHYWNPGSNGGANPYWSINRNTNTRTVDRVIGLISLKYQFTDALSVQVRSALDRINAKTENLDWNDSYIIADNGRFSLARSENYELNNDILIAFEKYLNDDLSLNISAGANARSERASSLSSNTNTALIVPNFFALGNTQNVASSHSIGAPRDVNSVYGLLSLGWKNAVYLDVTARNDWSSTLPKSNWSFFYPSAGLSVVLSDLTTLPDFISYAKFRGSWAQVGNDAVPFQLQRTAALTAGGNNGFLALSSTIPNENLKPEETTSFELGADLSFADNRIGIDFTYYKANTRNQLFSIALPIGSGASGIFTNGGDVQNKGIEAILNFVPVKTTNFNWNLGFNYTKNTSLVIEVNDERPRVSFGSDFLREFFVEQGEAWGNVYSRGFERDAQGRVIVGANGLPKLTAGRTVKIGNFNPDWLGGIRNSLNWKDLNLSFLVDIRQGGQTASITDAIIFGGGLVEETLQGRDGSLVFGQNFFENETAVKEDGTPNDLKMSAEAFWQAVGGRNAPVGEVFAVDASNVRLREVVLGYKLPINNSFIKGAHISLVGRNLFFFSNKAKTLDPESIVGTGEVAEGFESFSPPTARSFGFNLQLNF